MLRTKKKNLTYFSKYEYIAMYTVPNRGISVFLGSFPHSNILVAVEWRGGAEKKQLVFFAGTYFC